MALADSDPAVRPTALVLRALGVGDLLTAVPAFRAVRRGLPGHRVVLACPPALAPLALLTGAVDEVLDTAPLGPVDAVRPEIAVNLHGRGPQSTAALRATEPDRLVAYDAPGAPPWHEEEPERLRWVRLLAAHGLPGDPDDLDLPLPDVAPPAVGAVLVHPGAAYGSRRWPAERWADVARALVRAGEHVLVTGSAGELPLAREVAGRAGLPDAAVVAGRTDLLELVALVGASRLLLSGDTGVAHVATALGTPSVTLFGPASPARWQAPRDRLRHRVLWSGRTGAVFSQLPDPGLLRTTPPDVLAEAACALAAA